MPAASTELVPCKPALENFLVLPCNLGETLRSDQFKAALYITRCNEPASSYALQRSQHFATASYAQIRWMEAEDYFNDVHLTDMSAEEKMERGARWHQANYHARRTGNVPSVLPLVYDLPMLLLGGNYEAQHGRLKEGCTINADVY